MLSASLDQYSSEFDTGNMAMTNQQVQAPLHMSTSGLDTLAEGSQYLQQLQQQDVNAQFSTKGSLRHRSRYSNDSVDAMTHPLEESTSSTRSTKNGSDSGPVRRRISRACDQCNQLRTKCDGKTPCAHCVEFGLTCEYVRERKKRGKASRKDIAQQQAAVAAKGEGEDCSPRFGNENSSDDQNGADSELNQHGVKRRRSSSVLPPPRLPPPRSMIVTGHQVPPLTGLPSTLASLTSAGTVTNAHVGELNAQEPGQMTMDHTTPGVSLPAPRLPGVGLADRGMPLAMSDYGSIDDYHRSILHPTSNGHNILHTGSNAMPNTMMHHNMQSYAESPYAVPSPQSQQGPLSAFRIPGESPLSAGFLGSSSVAGSPGWLSLPSPSAALYGQMQQTATNQTLRYPVLRPLLAHISAIIPIGLACDLLDLYFSSTSSTFMQPQSPYILGYVFRKRSFLRPANPRLCSPALLASMLWVAAQTSESAFLTSPPSARGKICQKLLELTVGLLKPLIHSPTEGQTGYGGNTVINGVALGGFGVGMPAAAHEMDGGSPGATVALDDVATYIHLATVVSASEYKAASLRWWNAAWSLARELKLGRELPPNTEPPAQSGHEGQDVDADGEVDADIRTGGQYGANLQGQQHSTVPPGTVPEEEREERRRIWWLLYTVDRHLALCYNKPLFLLDVECDGLLQPEDDKVWQAGEYYPGENHVELAYFRSRGPTLECTGHSIFGYFLPLMTLLGEIVDLNHARNHPRFGLRFRSGSDWDNQAAEISQQLEAYGRSLKDFETRFTASPPEANQSADAAAVQNGQLYEAGSPSVNSVNTSTSGHRMTKSILQTRIVVAYGTHLMHTLHILLNGKWDPISLLDDNDLWISSQSFISATGHAVSAAEALSEILEYDPDLSFMPFFFGIYLLQSSFLLLLIADKLQGDASRSVVKACETIVRAHEACVVTLNTEYQRNFRKVMRSALAQVRGRLLEDFGEQQLRRREVLALYRWTGDGTGLAL